TNTAGVGNYPISATNAVGSGLGNYLISYVAGTLNVAAKGLTITANSTGKVYGNTVTFSGTEFTSLGLTNSDSVSSVQLASAGATNTAGVGNYPINATNAVGSGLGNYQISYVAGTLNVSAKGLTITANSTGKVYGNTVTFAGTEFSSVGLTNSDSVSSVQLASDGATNTAGVGNYPISATNAVGSGLGNYQISYVAGTLNVSAKGLTITANSTGKVYGNTVTFAGTEFSSVGLTNSDSVSSVQLASDGATNTAGVGNYPISATNAVGSGLGNYQ